MRAVKVVKQRTTKTENIYFFQGAVYRKLEILSTFLLFSRRGFLLAASTLTEY